MRRSVGLPLRGFAGGLHPLGVLRQPLRGVRPPAEDRILDPFEQFGFDLVVDLQHLGVDDPHVHACAHGVVEECRVHRLAHGVVAAEGEREVRNAARDLGAGQVFVYPARGVDIGFGVAVVFGHARGDGQDVGVEDDLFGRESVVRQQVVGPAGHPDLAFESVGLAHFVEKHHHRGCSVAADFAGPAQELLLALLERDGVDDGLALRRFHTGDQHLPLRRVDHHGHPGDLGLRSRKVQKGAHGLHTVDHAVVHADVDELRAGFHLVAGHREGFFVAAFADQPGELGRSGHVGAFAGVDEVGFGHDAQGFQAAQHAFVPGFGQRARGVAAHDLLQFEDVFRRRAAAASHHVQQPAAEIFAHLVGEHRRRFVVAARHVGESGVGVDRHAAFGHGCQPLQIGQQLPGPERAVEAHGHRFDMGHRGIERFHRLSRERAARGRERARDHHGQPAAPFVEQPQDGVDRRLGVERVEEGFEHQQVGAAVDESARLVVVGLFEFGEGQVAGRRVVHLRRERQRMVRRADRAPHEARFLRIAGRACVDRPTRRFGCRARNLVGVCFQSVVAQRHGIGVERVGGDDVGAGRQVFFVDRPHRVGLRERQQVVAAAQA